MKHAEFHRGLEFVGSGGFRWRCTDVGTRTIVAIRLEHSAATWYQGPPYIAEEVVFDEHELPRCHLTEEDAIRAAVAEADTSGHPGYPQDAMERMMKARYEVSGRRYPHAGVLRFDRRRNDSEILHPYAARQEHKAWVVQLYLPFLQTFTEMAEADFIALPITTAADVQTRADAGKK